MPELWTSILCATGLLPNIVFRYIVFKEQMNRSQKIAFGVSHFLFFVGFSLAFWKLMNVKMFDGESYYIAMLIGNIISTVMMMAILRKFVRENLFTAGLIGNIAMFLNSLSSMVMMFLPLSNSFDAIIKSRIMFLVFLIIFLIPIRHMFRITVSSFLNIDTVDYWNTLWMVPIILYLSSFFYHITDGFILPVADMIACYLICVVTVLVCWNVVKGAKQITQKIELNTLLDMQKQHYSAMVEVAEKDIEVRHNFKHNMAVVKRYIETEDYEKLKEYFHMFEINTNISFTIPYTGNSAADGILYHYAKIAATNGIVFDVKCNFKNTFVNDFDLCCLLGNALDNAVAACNGYDGKKYINLTTDKTDEMLFISVSNPYDGVILKEGKYILSKKRVHSRGVGLKSMRHVCAKYNGTCKIDYGDNKFEIFFVLNKS